MQTGVGNSFNEKFHVNICISQGNKTNLKKKRLRRVKVLSPEWFLPFGVLTAIFMFKILIPQYFNGTHISFLFFNNQPDALINQIHSVIKVFMFRASSLPIIRSSLLYIRHW